MLLKTTFFLAVQKGQGYFAMPVEDQILQIGIYLQTDFYKRMLQYAAYSFKGRGQ